MRFMSRLPKLGARTRFAAAAIVIAALGAGSFWLARDGAFDIAVKRGDEQVAVWSKAAGFAVANLAVVGRHRVSREAILAAVAAPRGTPLLAVDIDAAKTKLEALAWVKRAEIERQFPDTIFIRLTEREPMAFWQRQGKLALIDTEGLVVATDGLDGFNSLIVLVGEDAPQNAAALLDLLSQEPTLQKHVAAAVRVGGRRWNLRLDNGIDVALPEQDADAAWHRLATLERSEGLLERAILAVDLRLPDRYVLRMPEVPKPAAAKKSKSGKPT
jgi:cell division protein FtsQ